MPTTAGTGSETTGVAIFDLPADPAAGRLSSSKTGIAHRYVRPTLGMIDPDNTKSLPPCVAASAGLDVLSHALESYTATPFTERPMPDSPILRPAYQGSNPISDVWSLRAMEMMAANIVRCAADPTDDEARTAMLLAATYAGVGFGNAGVHLPHGMSYPIASNVKEWRPAGYETDHALVPHGISVIVTAPAVFEWTAAACPDRHLEGARALGADTEGVADADAGLVLADTIRKLMSQLADIDGVDMPKGLAELGYCTSDTEDLVQGTLPQHRVTKLSPRSAAEDDLSMLFEKMQVVL